MPVTLLPLPVLTVKTIPARHGQRGARRWVDMEQRRMAIAGKSHYQKARISAQLRLPTCRSAFPSNVRSQIPQLLDYPMKWCSFRGINTLSMRWPWVLLRYISTGSRRVSSLCRCRVTDSDYYQPRSSGREAWELQHVNVGERFGERDGPHLQSLAMLRMSWHQR